METMSARRGLCARPPSGKVGRTGRARGSNHICPKWSNMSGRGPSHQARRAGGLDGVPGSAIHSDYSLLWLGSLVYGRGEECVACDNLSRFERGQVMIRQTANAHKSTHTHMRAHGKRCIIIVMSGPSLPASSTTKCLEYWRRGWQQCGKIESYSLAAIPLRCRRRQHSAAGAGRWLRLPPPPPPPPSPFRHYC